DMTQDEYTGLRRILFELLATLLRDSFYALKRQAAPGVDGVTWKEYENGLEGRLADLHSRVHRGAYRARPSRRVYIDYLDIHRAFRRLSLSIQKRGLSEADGGDYAARIGMQQFDLHLFIAKTI